jgi:hypothetical protein
MSPRKARRRPAGMPSRPRRGGSRPAPARGGPPGEEAAIRLGPPQVQSWPDGDWIVRQVPGPAATKVYRCPGCDQEIPPGLAHVVAWPQQAGQAEGRRHWHNSCWQRRPRRPGPWQFPYP